MSSWQSGKSRAAFGDEPWWVRDLAKQTGTDEQMMRVALRQAAQQGIITAIVKDRYYRNDRIVAFANMIRELDQEGDRPVQLIFVTGLTSGANWLSRFWNILTALVLRVVGEMIIYYAMHYCSLKNNETINSWIK